MTRNKLPIAERGFNLVFTIFYGFFCLFFLAVSIALFIGAIHCFRQEDRVVGNMLLFFGILVFAVAVVLLYLLFVKKGGRGRLQNIDKALGKIVE